MTLKILPMYCVGPENELIGPVDALCEVTQHGNSGAVYLVEDVKFTNQSRDMWINRCFVCLGPLRVDIPIMDGRTFALDLSDTLTLYPSDPLVVIESEP